MTNILAFAKPNQIFTDLGIPPRESASARLGIKRVGARISMDGNGRCIDDIFIERLWRSLK
jgi:putative transposase